MSRWIPKFFCKRPDGGKKSGVTAYFLIEWKPVFSVGFLYFKKGSRDAFHTHAFNALTWWLSGSVVELHYPGLEEYCWSPSLKPKYTSRECFHKVIALKDTYAFTLRGPWHDTWKEYSPHTGEIVLTHGREKI